VRVGGTVRPPGDKSVTHRALILGGLTRTTVLVEHALVSGDTRSTGRVLRQVGARVSPLKLGDPVRVVGAAWHTPDAPLHCGNSGTTARLMLGALSGRHVTARVTGDASLRRRPMRRVTGPLGRMGATIVEEAGDGLPVTITGGHLRSFEYASPVASAQIKTALLLAGVSAGVPVTITEPARSRDHTERLLRFLGFPIRVDRATVCLSGSPAEWPRVPPFEVVVPGDLSSAAFMIALGLLAGGGELVIEAVGVNPTRAGFLDTVAKMGVRVETLNPRTVGGEPVADMVVRPSRLAAVDVAASEIPRMIDEIPVLAALASRAEGVSRFRSVGELRVKESDRLSLIASNLRTLGGEAAVEGEDLVVVGTDRPPVGRVDTAGDHRLAMAFAILGRLPGAEVRLSETASVGISYPRFFDDLDRVARA
jgi:3-phosphoshikimate 1-carboxyvinyltransferase